MDETALTPTLLPFVRLNGPSVETRLGAPANDTEGMRVPMCS